MMLCEVCIFLHCSNTGIVSSNLTWSVDVCAFLCVCVSFVGRDLGMGLFPTQGMSDKYLQQTSHCYLYCAFIKLFV